MNISKYKPHLAILGANLFYGANYTIAKFVMPEFLEPFAFIFLRVSGALLFFIFMQLFIPREKIESKDYLRLFFCGVFGVALNQLMFFKGLNLTVPINASMIMITTPILVMLLSAILLKEKMPWFKLVGLAFGLVGAFFMIGGKNFNFTSNTALGDSMVLVNAISYSVYLIIVKPLMVKYKPFTVIKWVFFFGFFPVLFFSYPELQDISFSNFTIKAWWSLGFVILGVTVGAYLLNIYGLSKVDPSVVGIYIYLQPILAIFFAWMFLGEIHLTFEKVIAGLLIFSGVYLVSFGKRHFSKVANN
tara:strand:+ start:1006 stop:1914 length:909 start_codon:yes stop_codon:yes gene_type:complete